jgi:hypothetical protein
MVGQVDFERVETIIDGLGQSAFPYEEWNGADATTGDRLCLGGNLVVDVRGGEGGLW